MGWTVRESNAGGKEILRTHSERPRDPLSIYNGYWVIAEGKEPRRGVGHPHQSTAEVKERVEV